MIPVLPSRLVAYLPNCLRLRRSGQIAIVMVIVTLMFLLIMFPVFDMFMRNESKWSVKEKKDTAAFHLAEAGVDRAKWKLLETNDMWFVLSSATIAGYNFDKVYSDVGGGTYTIQMSSHPTDQDMRVVESVGRDSTGNEIRRIKVVLKNENAADFAARAQNLVSNTGGNDHIEWGPVVSGNSIDATARTFPRHYSAGHVTPQDGGSTTAGTDDVYWWSYFDVPKIPNIKFANYLSSATDSGDAPDGCGNGTDSTYYFVGDAKFVGCSDTSNQSYYITGDATFASGKSDGNFIVGSVIMLGNFIVSGSGGANGEYDAHLPRDAWMEYGHDATTWAHYLTFDPDAPATYAQAVSGNYHADNHTYELDNVLIHGFMYTGGSEGLTGGGNCNLNGVLLSNQDTTMGTSTMGIYYDDQVAADIQIQGITIVQISWYEVKGEWPSGL